MSVLHLPTATPPDGLTSPVVADRAGISQRRLDVWLRAGCVTRAHHDRFTPAEADHIIRTARLARVGFRADIAAELARVLAETGAVSVDGLIITEATA